MDRRRQESSVSRNFVMDEKRQPGLRKPRWLVKRLPSGPGMMRTTGLLRAKRLHTVCQEAICPNQGECFSAGTATFLILGDRCTRGCRFCAVAKEDPLPPDPGEPVRVAQAVRAMGLRFAVVTSVTRDDLPDGGAGHFALTVQAIRELCPGTGVEILVPDFNGDPRSIQAVVAAGPDVLNHNLETVPRLYPQVRPGADYRRSLELLAAVKRRTPGIRTKSGLMLGLGEEPKEVRAVMEDLLSASCDGLTIGQYLAPSKEHLPVDRYVPPEEFQALRKEALAMGFAAAASGPFVRSSYRAGEMFPSEDGCT
ncbi:MAG: lipoyl synthase [Deltaproteobacteria bacterium]|nr:lipoyl synthase [Deltaproteobacteria bacterium]MBW2306719.1 lipoyl synthase [Deltaproteobacteria bacterium]